MFLKKKPWVAGKKYAQSAIKIVVPANNHFPSQAKPVTIAVQYFKALPCHEASANRFSRVAEG
jgi:hypothetical protein